MKYKMEELIPIVAKLSEKYTGFESSSITYEKARQLMGAVIYCIREANKYDIEISDLPNDEPEKTQNENNKNTGNIQNQNSNEIMKREKATSAQKTYEIGYENVIKKVKASIVVYHHMLTYFDDYGNRCLADTVLKGIPEFFKWYDVKFNPQDTILTLDYPVIIDMSRYEGVDAIYIYLKCIEKEQMYLKQFDRTEILKMLEGYDPEYKDMIDNVYQVIHNHFSDF